MTVSMLRADDADKQRAFLGLLATPVVTPWTDDALYVLVHRHAHTLTTWCKRLGYRLAHLDQCYRLRRVPVDGAVALPVGARLDRPQLLLSLYAAASLEDHREDSITLQEISDVVRLSAAGRGGWPYDPDQRRHRSLFVTALDWLVSQGVLELRTDDALRQGWEVSGEGIGAGYIIHRDALMLLIDTGDVDLALARRVMEGDDTRGVRLLRAIVETQALYPDELDDADRTYLTGQRARLARLAEEMTGGAVEIRSDVIALTIAPDRSLPASLQLDFPGATALDWACLALIDDLAGAGAGTREGCGEQQARDLAADLHERAGRQLTVELRESPDALMRAVGERLGGLGLLRIADGCWRLTPLAARYRDAELRSAHDEPPPTLMELE
ncbi:MAG: DUF2398 family protein [Propionibacterium sp.]|nr:DUF2398 family protein [Propionibacterium sp.]